MGRHDPGSPRGSIAFLSMESLEGWASDDHCAVPFLKALGWEVEFVPWRTRDSHWDRYSAVVVRSTWDYHRDPEAFLALMGEVEAKGGLLLNPSSLIRWNADKRYLLDLERAGVPIVPTVWIDSFREDELPGAARMLRAEEFVVKPRIGAGSEDTFRIGPHRGWAPSGLSSLRGRAVLLQPFLESIPEEGEFSLILLGGTPLHCVRKRPAEGDFRVQEEFGGTVEPVAPPPGVLAAAAAALAPLDPVPFQARADFARLPEGDFALMELELIEPSLYLSATPGVAGSFASALDQWIRGPAD